MEEWKRIILKGKEYPYEVSDLGNVRRIGTTANLKPMFRKHRRGTYAYVDLSRFGIRKRMVIHRLVALHFCPNPDGKWEVNHFDGNPLNNEACNLEWCTREENEMHKRFLRACEEVCDEKVAGS